MRVLLISDTHGDTANLLKVLEKHNDINNIIFTGDGLADIRLAKSLYKDKIFYSVNGNCDFNFKEKDELSFRLDQKSIFITHGHNYYVKSTLQNLYAHAVNIEANIVVYGHTHIQKCDYENGVYMINPGSLRGYNGSYAILEISGDNILVSLLNLY